VVLSKSRLRAAGFALAVAAVVLYFVARDDEAARVRAPVERIKSALAYDASRENARERSSRIEREIEASVEPDVVVSIPETAGGLSGREAVLRFVTDVGDLRRLELGVTDAVVSFDAKKETAQLTARIAVDAWRSDYESHQVRNASIRLLRREQGWKVTSVTVAPRTHEEPEARP
jgi:hypothetical protein